MPPKKRAARSFEQVEQPPAKQQASLESFGFHDLAKMQLRGRAVTKKTAKGTKGYLKRNDFEVTAHGKLEIKVPVKEKDARSRQRAGEAHLKRSAKKYHMKTAKMKTLLQEYPALEIINSERGKYLRCSVCYDFVLDSKVKASPSHIKEHLNTPKHQRYMKQKASQLSCVTSMKDVFKVESSTPEDETNIFRARCVEAFVGAGIPLQKVDLCRDFLQFYCHRQLSDSANLRKFVPILRKIQRDEIKAAIRLYPIFIIHDGTNRFSEFYAIVVRWVDDTFIEQVASGLGCGSWRQFERSPHTISVTWLPEGQRGDQCCRSRGPCEAVPLCIQFRVLQSWLEQSWRKLADTPSGCV
jgi:hypothetical protein